FFRDQANTEEHGDQHTHQRRGGEAEVLDDLHVLSRGQLREQKRRGHQQHRKEHEVVRHPVADRVFEDAACDGEDGCHDAVLSRTMPASSVARTCCTKKSSSVSRTGLRETRRAPVATSSASSCSGATVNGSSSEKR